MKKVFVTGGTGFTGAFLLRKLVQDPELEIYALKRSSSPFGLVSDIAPRINWVEGDLNDIVALGEGMRGMHQVYHCAGAVSFDPADRQRLYKVNVEGTANIVNIALDEGVEKFVHMSSIAALGRTEKEKNKSENSDWEDSPLNSHYAISKFKGEAEVWRGIEEGLNAVIVNPSVILGPGYWKDGSAALFFTVWKGLSMYPSGGSGYVDVNDVVDAMIRLMNSDIQAERFVLNGENLSWQEVFTSIAQTLGKTPPRKKFSPFLGQVAWRVEWLRSRITGYRPLITRETVISSAHRFYYDNSKLLKAFPDFKYTPIADTIKRTGEIFLRTRDDGFGVY